MAQTKKTIKEPKLKKRTIKELNAAYTRRKLKKRHPEGWEPEIT